jgi:predicted DNA binding protein
LQRLEKALKSKYQVQDFLAKRQASTTSMTKSNFLLKEAFERGYFDVPKGTSIEELSRDLNIPLSTLDIDIRRALKNVLLESTC